MAVLAIALTVLIKLPGYLKFKQYEKQGKARKNLEQIYDKEMDYFRLHHKFAESFSELDWKPEMDEVYTYFIGKDSIQSGQGTHYGLPPDIKSFSNDTNFQAVAVGNIDHDATMDIWSINEKKAISNILNDRNN